MFSGDKLVIVKIFRQLFQYFSQTNFSILFGHCEVCPPCYFFSLSTLCSKCEIGKALFKVSILQKLFHLNLKNLFLAKFFVFLGAILLFGYNADSLKC